ncbi:MAG: hypothetical protein ACOCZ6_04335 [Nanoarchaeota archaeon]
MNKKAVELGLNTIVVAVIAITVMAVVLIFFTGQFGDARGEIESCASRLGTCVESEDDCDGRVIDAECPDEKPDCCFDPMSSADEDVDNEEGDD